MKLKWPLSHGAVVLNTLDESASTPAYLKWMQDPEIGRFLESRFSEHSLGSLAEFIRLSNEAPNVVLAGIFNDGRHVGNIKIRVDAHHKRGEMGIMIGDRDAWGRGLGRAAIGLLADYAFSELGVVKLTAGCYADNIGSIRVFEAAGFRREATRKGHYVSKGTRVDGVYLARFAPGHGAAA
jgi:RimJ/RimL family protein N-acetyltransferase